LDLDPVLQRIDKFHAHLGECSQCERHPFDLCPKGALLLRWAATGEEDTPELDLSDLLPEVTTITTNGTIYL